MLPRQLAGFNRIVTNRTYGRLAGHAPWMGIVVHRGRKTGREYRTPVNVHRFEDGYRISLDYGPGSDWVRNVIARGGCTMVSRGKSIELSSPRVVEDAGATWAPPALRRVLTTVGSGYYLQLRYADRQD